MHLGKLFLSKLSPIKLPKRTFLQCLLFPLLPVYIIFLLANLSTTNSSEWSVLPNGTEEPKLLSKINASNEESFLKHVYVRVALIAVYSLVFFAILFGNTVLIAALGTNRETLTPTNIFVLNLAFADLCVAIFCVYQNLSLYLVSEWIFSDLLCRMYHFVHAISYTASVSIHVAIALER